MQLEEVAFLKPNTDLLNRLLPVARGVFTDTFSQRYEPAAFERFCEEVYRPGGTISRDFNAPGVRWLVGVAAGQPIGYAKLTPLRAPAVNPDPTALELQQLYVLRQWHGTGVADRLTSWALETAATENAREVYLTVFDHNERAKRFYARYGFEEVGRCTFQLGDRVDDDRIWRVRLPR
ncbi:GNAT family N-acetyltransferase [Paracoccus sp. (in: a-proteobacteria)]|uniref:GNAT family N-acetyltransferase n=1 Tax=Paracoccus sp. TaxID=267 RepID=UPI002588B214|nr:GNAT family N-acetyltransferase [Paracoccus sp. (in: a-proteobacteria)]